MAVVKRAVAAVEARAPRVSLVLKADIRPAVTDGLTSKVETVERHLAGPAEQGRGAAPAKTSPGRTADAVDRRARRG